MPADPRAPAFCEKCQREGPWKPSVAVGMIDKPRPNPLARPRPRWEGEFVPPPRAVAKFEAAGLDWRSQVDEVEPDVATGPPEAAWRVGTDLIVYVTPTAEMIERAKRTRADRDRDRRVGVGRFDSNLRWAGDMLEACWAIYLSSGVAVKHNGGVDKLPDLEAGGYSMDSKLRQVASSTLYVKHEDVDKLERAPLDFFVFGRYTGQGEVELLGAIETPRFATVARKHEKGSPKGRDGVYEHTCYSIRKDQLELGPADLLKVLIEGK